MSPSREMASLYLMQLDSYEGNTLYLISNKLTAGFSNEGLGAEREGKAAFYEICFKS